MVDSGKKLKLLVVRITAEKITMNLISFHLQPNIMLIMIRMVLVM